MEGGVDGGSTNSAELWTIGWTCCMISLPSFIPKREEPSLLSQQWLLLDELLFDFSTIVFADTWWVFTFGGDEHFDDWLLVKLFILIYWNSYIIWNINPNQEMNSKKTSLQQYTTFSHCSIFSLNRLLVSYRIARLKHTPRTNYNINNHNFM